MKIFSSLKQGFSRSVSAGKGVLIAWFLMFILVLVLMHPLRKTLGEAFGTSMITERLAEGFDIEIFADLGPVLQNLMSFLTSGFTFIFLIGFLLNSFLTAGLFGSVGKEKRSFSAGEFFRSASHNFWQFLIITVIVSLLLSFITFIVVGIPFGVVASSGTISETGSFRIMGVSFLITILIIPVFLLIADYARAYRSAHGTESCFRALGFGFGHTFNKFWPSYFMMLILIIAQVFCGIIVLLVLPAWNPVTAGGVFLLLIISQLMLYFRFLLKTWRYASVTALMEQTIETARNNS